MCATYIKVVINYEQGGNINEKSRVLATTTLAGALLFTGLGNVDATQTVNDSNIREYAQNTLGSHYTKSGTVSIGGGWSDIEPEDHGIKDRGNYYDVVFYGEKTMVSV